MHIQENLVNIEPDGNPKGNSKDTFSLIGGWVLIGAWLLIELWNLVAEHVILGNHFVLQIALLFTGIALVKTSAGIKDNQT